MATSATGPTSSYRMKSVKLLVANPGSATLKLDLFNVSDGSYSHLRSGYHTQKEIGSDKKYRQILEGYASSDVACVIIRFVHGGHQFFQPTHLSENVVSSLTSLTEIAPLHTFHSLRCHEHSREIFPPPCRLIAVFDTAYFQHLPPLAQRYALPQHLVEKYQIRRYGFHGFAHAAMVRHWYSKHSTDQDDRLITLQLGSGCSATAVHGQQPQDTSMGFTPNEGLMMGTRSGDVDPGLLTYLQRKEKWDMETLDAVLNRQAGLLGVSNESSDIAALIASETPMAKNAVDSFCYRIQKIIGAYVVVLGGLDGLLFSGGIGEHSMLVRECIVERLSCLGLSLDLQRNRQADGRSLQISPPGKSPEIWTVKGDEAGEIASHVMQSGIFGALNSTLSNV